MEGDYIKNNTRFIKPQKKGPYDLFKRNVAFVSSENLKKNINALVLEKDVNTIRLTDDYLLDNLDFLSEYNFDFIKSIDILSNNVHNVEGLYSLTNLECINSTNKNIDYDKLSNLKSLSGELSSFSYNTLLESKGLESIRISNFNKKDLLIFSKNTKLEQLMLRGSKLTSLKGLENLKFLQSLELFQNGNLTSLEGIINVHNEYLKEVNIYKAPKLFFVNDYLSKLTNLENLQLACKKIDSLKFLKELNFLKSLSIHNKIIQVDDNDKKPLINALKKTNGKIW